MKFNDKSNPIYIELKYPDCIVFHDQNGQVATASRLWVADAIQESLENAGYEVKLISGWLNER